MELAVLTRLGVGVDQGRGQPGQGVQQAVLGGDRDLVRLDRAGIGAHGDLALGPHPVTDPAQPHVAGAQHAGRGPQD
jgi:hypothetical protein